MSRTCSLCLTESTNRSIVLTPLYTKHGNIWSGTGLSEMIKSCDIKIKKSTDTCALHVICNLCIYKTCLSYFEKYPSTDPTLPTIQPSNIKPLMNISGNIDDDDDDDEKKYSVNTSIIKFDPNEFSNVPNSSNKNYNDSQYPNKKIYPNKREYNHYIPLQLTIDYINKISDYCLAEIFTYLKIYERLNIERVCKRWRKVGKSLAWRDIRVIDTSCDKFSHIVNNQDDIKKLISRCGPRLKELTIHELCQSSIIISVKKHCDNLIKLKLHLDNYDEKDFIDGFKNMNDLRSIEITIKDLVPKTIPMKPPKLFYSVNKNIEEIIVSSSWIDASRTIYYPAPPLEKFFYLRYLKLTACCLDKYAIDDISNCKNLIELELIRCKLLEDELLISYLRNLRHLKLIQSGTNIDEFLLNLEYESRDLRYLDIGGTTSVSKTVLKGLPSFKKLKYLDIGLIKNIDDNIILGIVKKCKYLEYLNIRECSSVSEAAIKILIKNCNYLGKLDISMTGHKIKTLVSAAKIIRKRKSNIVLRIVSRSSLITRFYRLKNLASFSSPLLEFSHHPDDEPWGYDYNQDYQDSFDSNDSDNEPDNH